MFNFKKRFIVFLVFILLFIVCNNTYYGVFAREIAEKKDKKLILIDPGHGGFDGGARVNGIEEKNVNLSIALLLKESLIKNGYDVLMTREKDEALKLDKSKKTTRKSEDMEVRCKLKMESNCNMFISIHMNTFPESKYYGGQVWYSKCPESRRLAGIIQRDFKTYLDSTNNRVEKPAFDSYKVLRCNDTIPGVIIECGFLSNPEERGKLANEEYQRKVAETITKSINEFYKQ